MMESTATPKKAKAAKTTPLIKKDENLDNQILETLQNLRGRECSESEFGNLVAKELSRVTDPVIKKKMKMDIMKILYS